MGYGLTAIDIRKFAAQLAEANNIPNIPKAWKVKKRSWRRLVQGIYGQTSSSHCKCTPQGLHEGLHQGIHQGLIQGLPQNQPQGLPQDQPQGPLHPLQGHPLGGCPEDGTMGWHLANALDLAEHNDK
ncbi:hypothetical protein FOCC_FOCC016273 [Frankliniella occidentalis]|nr:hypothetical protein FOCC_FOCC016273 [Frankliniella occidentalis]